MNQLTYTSSTINQDGSTTVYLTPTNSQHVVSLSEAYNIYLHVLDVQGQPVRVIPVQYDDDGVYFKIDQLTGFNPGTYAFYLELKYSDEYFEYYPDNSVKYMTLANGDKHLSLTNIFNADYNTLKPIRPPKSPDTDGGWVPNDDTLHNVKIAETVTLPAGQRARVEVNKDTIKFYIPSGQSGASAYQEWLNEGHTGTEKDFIDSLSVKDAINSESNRKLIKSWINDINQATNLGSYVNVKSFGALGDGYNDDTASLQRAINSVHRDGGGLLLFPTGTYVISKPITIYSNISIYGTNIFATTLQMNTANQPFFNSEDNDDITIKNMSFTSVRPLLNGGLNFRVRNNANIRNLNIENVQVENSNVDGIAIENPLLCSIRQTLSSNNKGYGFSIIGSGATNSNINMQSTFALYNGKQGFNLTGLSFSNFDNCVSQNNYGSFLIDSCHGSSFNACGDINTKRGSTDATTGIGYRVTASDSLIFNSIYSDTRGSNDAQNLIGMYLDSSEITVNGFHLDGSALLGINCTDKVLNSSFSSINIPAGVNNNIPYKAQINPVINEAIKYKAIQQVVDYFNNNIKAQMDTTINGKFIEAVKNLSFSRTLDGGTDLNKVKASGLYSVADGAVTNVPEGAAQVWLMLIVVGNGSNGLQILSDTNQNKVWLRNWYSSNTWTPWTVFRGPKGEQGNPGATGPAGKDGRSVWYNTTNRGPSQSLQWFTDLTNASASNPPKVNDIMINADGNMAMITKVNITNDTGEGGGEFYYGPWIGNIKGPKGDQGDPGFYHYTVDLTDAKYDRNKWYYVEANGGQLGSLGGPSYFSLEAPLDGVTIVPYGKHGNGNACARQSVLYGQSYWGAYGSKLIVLDDQNPTQWTTDSKRLLTFAVPSSNSLSYAFYARGGLRINIASDVSGLTWTPHTDTFVVHGTTIPVLNDAPDPKALGLDDDHTFWALPMSQLKQQLKPVKGVDYWTDEDKKEIFNEAKKYVEDEILNRGW